MRVEVVEAVLSLHRLDLFLALRTALLLVLAALGLFGVLARGSTEVIPYLLV